MRTTTSSIAAADGVAFEGLDGATAIFARIFHLPCFAARFSLWLGAHLRVSFLLKPRPNIKSHGLERRNATSYNRGFRTRKMS